MAHVSNLTLLARKQRQLEIMNEKRRKKAIQKVTAGCDHDDDLKRFQARFENFNLDHRCIIQWDVRRT